MTDMHVHDEGCLRVTAEVHLGYELRQLGAMAGARMTEAAELAATGVFEATLVHARVLHEFLTRKLSGSRRYCEQVCASDYMGSPWASTSSLDQSLYDLICRRVVHIYCDRHEGPDWLAAAHRVTVARTVLAAFRDFVGELAAVHPDRAGWFVTALAEAEQELEASERGAYVYARILPASGGRYTAS